MKLPYNIIYYSRKMQKNSAKRSKHKLKSQSSRKTYKTDEFTDGIPIFKQIARERDSGAQKLKIQMPNAKNIKYPRQAGKASKQKSKLRSSNPYAGINKSAIVTRKVAQQPKKLSYMNQILDVKLSDQMNRRKQGYKIANIKTNYLSTGSDYEYSPQLKPKNSNFSKKGSQSPMLRKANSYTNKYYNSIAKPGGGNFFAQVGGGGSGGFKYPKKKGSARLPYAGF